MTTYEQGHAPKDAPVAWQVSRDKRGEYHWHLSDGSAFVCTAYSEDAANRTARAFHLAKLAEEAASTVEAFGTDSGGFRSDWLRRYREA